jgi:hypothetical protein
MEKSINLFSFFASLLPGAGISLGILRNFNYKYDGYPGIPEKYPVPFLI